MFCYNERFFTLIPFFITTNKKNQRSIHKASSLKRSEYLETILFLQILCQNTAIASQKF